jgi:hypothetical protein
VGIREELRMPALVITRHIAQLLASVSDRWVEVWNQFIRHPELDADITNRQNAPLLRSYVAVFIAIR